MNEEAKSEEHVSAPVEKVENKVVYAEPKQPFLTVPVAIIIAGALIAGAVYMSSGKTSGSSDTAAKVQQAPNTQPADISKVSTAGDPFIGNPSAPVTVAYWYDHQCPFCKKYEVESMPQLIDEYVKPGKVKVVFKVVDILGQDSQTAALAALAVWDVAPARFYEWHKTMFGKQGAENSGWATKEKVIAITRTVPGVDADKVAALMTSKEAEYQKRLTANHNDGAKFGINGTPSFIIGTTLIPGALPYATIKAAVDAALKR